MGVRLMVEILDHAPPELSPAERLVLIAIAEDIRDGGDRTGCPGVELLCHRTGLSEEGLRKVFQRLAKRNLEIRVAIGKGKSGRLVFAKPGVRTTYRLPMFAAEEGGEWQYEEPEGWDESTAIKAVQTSQGEEMAVQTSPTSGREAQNSGQEYRPSPSSPSSPTTYMGADDGGLFEKPTPQPKKRTPTKKKTEAPERLDITDRMRTWAAENTPGLNLELETLKFLNHHGAKGSMFIDWVKAWRTWMINALQYAEKNQKNRTSNLRVVGGARQEVPDAEYWSNLSEEELRNIL